MQNSPFPFPSTEAMANNLSLLLLLPLLLFSSLLVSSALAASPLLPDDLRLPSSVDFPLTHAEKLIRALNLFPKDASPELDASAPDHGDKRIVERSFAFPTLSDGVSVDDLGHHAGYYRLPNTHGARLDAPPPSPFRDLPSLGF